ncbi:MAG: class I SAM-dependent methyltransferase [Candidatus Omnitrophica bacterium]|nr:class I SAM-dependent methyltransferase [Candidatus Omnitrophota bacterium]
MNFVQADAGKLPFGDGSFDIVLQAYTFSSILDDDMKHLIAGEMMRVVKKEGLVIWEDACSAKDVFYDEEMRVRFKGIPAAEIKGLFPGCVIDMRKTSLKPRILDGLHYFTWGGIAKKIGFKKAAYTWRYPWAAAEILSTFGFCLRSLHAVIKKR